VSKAAIVKAGVSSCVVQSSVTLACRVPVQGCCAAEPSVSVIPQY
jgi:hypothetical protein